MRSGVANAIAAGLLVVGILVGMAGFYVATTFQTRTATQTQTVTQTETTTSKLTATVTVAPLKCGTVVTTDTTLGADVGPCSGDGLVIGASHIVLNCAGHSISADTSREISIGVSLVGINLTGMTKVTIENCYVSGFLYGFYIGHSSRNTLSGDAANNNTVDGFHIAYSSSNILINDSASDNAHYGFNFSSSSSNILVTNVADGSTIGFFVYGSSNNNTLSGNVANGDWNGIFISVSSGNTLTGNSANGNRGDGFTLLLSSSNTLTGNTANGNAGYGYDDTSIGSGTRGTANLYSGDACLGDGLAGSYPSGLGTPQP